jgi:hypothetical protein
MSYQEPVQFGVLGIEEIEEFTLDAGVTVDGVVFDQDTGIGANTISEYTSAAGITVKGLLFKDGALPAADRYVINRQRSDVPTAVSSGTIVYLDDDVAFDLFARQNDGSSSKTQCIMPAAAVTATLGAYTTATDLTYTSGFVTLTSTTVPAGTYMVTFSATLVSSTNVCYAHVSSASDGSAPISGSKHAFFRSTDEYVVAGTFSVVASATTTYYFQAKRNTGNGGTVLDVRTSTIDGASYAINIPRLNFIRVA